MAQIQFTVLIDENIKEVLDEIKDSEGIPLAAQLRFALLSWLETKGRNLTKLKRAK